MEVPYLSLRFDNANADKSAMELVYTLNPSWKNSEGPVETVRFTDGITNTLTKVVKKWPGKTELESDEAAILVRAYGKDTDILINRDREVKAHSLLASTYTPGCKASP